MRVPPQQLGEHLRKGLAPVYVVSGDEPLLVAEACAAIAAAAAKAGYERNVLTVETGFDWQDFSVQMHSPSLFSPRALYELRISNGKPGEAGAAALAAFAAAPPTDTVLLVVLPKLDKAAQQSTWFKALDAAGAWVAVWPLEANQYPAWVSARLRAQDLAFAPEVPARLAFLFEGNLLACAQEIDKLALLFKDRTLALADLDEVLSDQSRFSVYAWVDACLGGEADAVLHRLARLREEGVEPILLVWALARELRQMSELAQALAQGKNEAALFTQYRIFSNRQTLVRQGLRRIPAAHWPRLLGRLARVDRINKGRAQGDAWIELEALGLRLCGVRSPPLATH